MNQDDLPPFPGIGEKGPQVCATTRLYLAIVDDLSSEQVRIPSTHLQECEGCAAEFRLLQQTTSLVASLPQSAPSAHIDAAILATLQSWDSRRPTLTRAGTESVQNTIPTAPVRRTLQTSLSLGHTRTGTNPVPTWLRKTTSWFWPSALVAALLLLVLTGTFLYGLIFPANPNSALQIPANLSWSGYVLHYTQTRTDTQGKNYQMEVYQNLGTHQMHIESTMPDRFDVVVVTDASTMMGKDMMHHVAQMGNGVEPWAVNGSPFDLAHLRQDLATQRATYLGKGKFQGQEVYQVRTGNNQVLLLNMRYLPVTALQNSTSSGTGTPLYNTCVLTPSTQVSDTMWDMRVPPDFHIGELPSKP